MTCNDQHDQHRPALIQRLPPQFWGCKWLSSSGRQQRVMGGQWRTRARAMAQHKPMRGPRRRQSGGGQRPGSTPTTPLKTPQPPASLQRPLRALQLKQIAGERRYERRHGGVDGASAQFLPEGRKAAKKMHGTSPCCGTRRRIGKEHMEGMPRSLAAAREMSTVVLPQ